jgi:hypothetical protein
MEMVQHNEGKGQGRANIKDRGDQKSEDQDLLSWHIDQLAVLFSHKISLSTHKTGIQTVERFFVLLLD